MKFKKVKLTNWQQFEAIDIDFHDRLTILTGVNGSGKTTILMKILAKHCNWNSCSLATPIKDIDSKDFKWSSGIHTENEDPIKGIIGNIIYSDNNEAHITIPKQVGTTYQPSLTKQKNLDCFFIPSHRAVFRYQALSNIPTPNVTISTSQAFQRVESSNRNHYQEGNDRLPSNFHMKEILISWSIFGHGNQNMESNQKLLDNYYAFESVLKIVLPKELGFNKLSIRKFEILLECSSGDFLIDAASGGLSTIIDMAWQIYMYSTTKNNQFTVIIDEVENHLHPTMQRKILSSFLEAFPNAVFIVSTHSPLIISSVRDSTVFILRHNAKGKIISQKLDFRNQAKTAAEILDEVLDVSFTMPIWVEDELKEIINKYAKQELVNEQTFKNMRADLSTIGLEKLMPTAIVNLVKEKDA